MTEIPFHMLGAGLPIITVPALVNGEGPFCFVLDTGNALGRSATVLLSEALARRFCLETVKSDDFKDPYAVGDAQGPAIRCGRIDWFVLGDIATPGISVGVSDFLDRLGEQVGARIDGNIGYAFLKDYAVSIDYAAQILRLDGGSTATGGAPFQLGPVEPFIIVPGLVNGRGPYHFVVDTGAGLTAVSERLVSELALERGKAAVVRGGAGDTGGFITQIDTLDVAGARCGEMSVVASSFFGALSAAAGIAIDGIIGYNVLRQYAVTIDYPRSTILFGTIKS